MVMVGDFNSVCNPNDHFSGVLDGTSDQLRDLLASHDLWEPGGSHHLCFTYHHPSMNKHKSCLDCIYTNASFNWLGYAQPVSFSDHYFVSVFSPRPADVGPQPWWFPNDLLMDQQFCGQIELILSGFKENDSVASWEGIKGKVQMISQKATQFCQKQAQLELQSLKQTLKYVNKHIFDGDSLEQDRQVLEARIAQIRDREWFTRDDEIENDWISVEGKISPKFLHLEDVSGLSPLESLNLDRKLTSEVGNILGELQSFYKDLNTAHDVRSDSEIEEFLSSLTSLPKMVVDVLAMTSEITSTEIEVAIKSLCIGRSPGSDGLIADLYRYFQD